MLLCVCVVGVFERVIIKTGVIVRGGVSGQGLYGEVCCHHPPLTSSGRWLCKNSLDLIKEPLYAYGLFILLF